MQNDKESSSKQLGSGALKNLLEVIDHISNCGSVDDFTVAGIRAELRDALFEYNRAPEQSEVSAAPVHPFELRISIGANDWNYARQVISEINEILQERDPEHVAIASGGWNGSYSITCVQRDISADDFRKELEQWRQNQK